MLSSAIFLAIVCQLPTGSGVPTELLERIERHRPERRFGIVQNLYEQIEALQPGAAQALLGLGEIYASEGKLKKLNAAKTYLQRFLALKIDKNFTAAFKDPLGARLKARTYLWYLEAKRKLWVASSFERIASDLKVFERKKAGLVKNSERWNKKLKGLRVKLAERKKKRKKIGKISNDISKRLRDIKGASTELARLDRLISVLKAYMGRKEVKLASPSTLLAKVKPELRIDRGLSWLADNQQKEGQWLAAKVQHNVGITGLALLTLLASGSTETSGDHKHSVARGIEWLLKQQDPKSGRFGFANQYMTYDHLIATRAMIEATRLAKPGDKDRQTVIRVAIKYIHDARNPYNVWRYGKRDGENDSSITSWAVFALTAAKRSDFEVSTDALKYSIAWYDQMTDPSSGKCGYVKRGEISARHQAMVVRFPGNRSEALTAQALLARFRLGQEPMKLAIHKAIVEQIRKLPPRWSDSGDSNEFYYWYHATQALSLVGGKSWKEWRKNLYQCLAQGQLWDGSWKAIGPWCGDGGLVYSTAIAVTCLLTAEGHNKLLPKR